MMMCVVLFMWEVNSVRRSVWLIWLMVKVFLKLLLEYFNFDMDCRMVFNNSVLIGGYWLLDYDLVKVWIFLVLDRLSVVNSILFCWSFWLIFLVELLLFCDVMIISRLGCFFVIRLVVLKLMLLVFLVMRIVFLNWFIFWMKC